MSQPNKGSSVTEPNASSSKPVHLTAKERLIVALDVPDLDAARGLMKELRGEVGVFKAGLELFTHCGVQLFEAMKEFEVPFFFDCKFKDIPNTVAKASEQLVKHELFMFNLHATGGLAMMETTMRSVEKQAAALGVERPKVIAVTILTSLNDAALANELGYGASAAELVPRLAQLTKKAGLDGVVASAHEASAIRAACGPDFLIITPGIRPSWAAGDDQARIVTPADAIANGADYLVVGRPITKAENPVEAARKVVADIQAGLDKRK